MGLALHHQFDPKLSILASARAKSNNPCSINLSPSIRFVKSSMANGLALHYLLLNHIRKMLHQAQSCYLNHRISYSTL
ncbi:hypothetical protein HJC23_005473 [Cyclotella cryptica]|uniref:Uncharacterized protein n=1 Tax=Cyclotella cryptica TaxID=29204 RepID=A0ABD3PJ94_9STRA